MGKRNRGLFGGRSRKQWKPKRVEPALGQHLGRVGILTRQPLVWLAATAVLAGTGKPKARRAALRGPVCYLLGALIGNLPKPLFMRPQPRHRRAKKPQVMRGSFPSGHGAAEVAYVFGASQEAPGAFVPLGTMALLAHWSLVRTGKHYLSDMLVGGTMGLVVVAIVARAWPPHRPLILDLPIQPPDSSAARPARTAHL